MLHIHGEDYDELIRLITEIKEADQEEWSEYVKEKLGK